MSDHEIRRYAMQSGENQQHNSFRARLKVIAGFLFVSIWFVACAETSAPSGGPEDRTVPVMLSSVPSDGATAVDEIAEVTFVMSEPLNPQSLSKHIFVSPRPKSPMKIKTQGVTVRAVFAEPISDSATYTVTLGAGAQDLLGNTLGKSKSVTFTRGAELDSGHIEGVVRDGLKLVKGVFVVAFRAFQPQKIGDMDSLYADYLTVTGDSGEFKLPHLPPGPVFVVALEDKNADQRFQYGKERYGLPSHEIIVGQNAAEWVELRLHSSDTTSPDIQSVVALASDVARVTLTRNVDPVRLWALRSQISLGAALPDTTKYMCGGIRSPHGPARNRFDLAFPGALSGQYTLNLALPREREGAPTIRHAPLSLTELSDTTAPHQDNGPTRREYAAPWEYVTLDVYFTEPISVKSDLDDCGVIRRDNGQTLPTALVLRDSYTISATLGADLFPGDEVALFIDTLAVVDRGGRTLSGLASVRQRVYSGDSLGTIVVPVRNLAQPGYSSDYVFSFLRNGGGDFVFRGPVQDSLTLRLPSGEYGLEVWEDSSVLSASKRDDGEIYPLRWAERRAILPIPVSVRARFTTLGPTLEIH